MLKRLSRAVVGAVAVGLLCASASFAQNQNYGPVLTFDGGIHGQSLAQMYGWTFEVVNPGFHINLMGMWDQNGDGIAANGHGHEVGLWDGGGNLLASTTITAASTKILANGEDVWRVNSIADILLGPGTYTLGALYPENDADLFSIQSTSVVTIPQVIYRGSVTNAANTFERPTISTPATDPGYFGPIIGHVGAPEPGSLALLALGVAGGVVAFRRRNAG